MEDYSKKIQDLETTTNRIAWELFALVAVYFFTTAMLFVFCNNLSDFNNSQQKQIDKLETILKVKGLWVN